MAENVYYGTLTGWKPVTGDYAIALGKQAYSQMAVVSAAWFGTVDGWKKIFPIPVEEWLDITGWMMPWVGYDNKAAALYDYESGIWVNNPSHSTGSVDLVTFTGIYNSPLITSISKIRVTYVNNNGNKQSLFVAMGNADFSYNHSAVSADSPCTIGYSGDYNSLDQITCDVLNPVSGGPIKTDQYHLWVGLTAASLPNIAADIVKIEILGTIQTTPVWTDVTTRFSAGPGFDWVNNTFVYNSSTTNDAPNNFGFLVPDSGLSNTRVLEGVRFTFTSDNGIMSHHYAVNNSFEYSGSDHSLDEWSMVWYMDPENYFLFALSGDGWQLHCKPNTGTNLTISKIEMINPPRVG